MSNDARAKPTPPSKAAAAKAAAHPASDRPGAAGGKERRVHDRHDVTWSVDCVADDTFLYASIANISEMGIFVRSEEPLALGTRVTLAFAPPGHEAFRLTGEVAWINPVRPNGDNPNPGMGVRFIDLTPDNRERLVEVVRTIAYVRD
jgi:type IV pilus assembly protein PilZ